MTRTVRNVGPALVALTLAIMTAGGLAIATSTSGSSSASAASSLSMLNPSIYGTGVGYDTKANLQVGPAGQKMAIRFKASTTSALNSVRFVQRGGAGYSLGTGGTMKLSVQADDGTGHPSATSLASQSYTPGNPSGSWEKYDLVTFPSPATLTGGSIYYIVFTNASTSNYISVNSVCTYNATSPRQPMFSDSDYGLMYTSGSWGALSSGYTPVVDLTYANGTHDGQSYYEAMIANYATISGANNMAREQFTVSGGDRTVGSASIRLRRSSGTSPLVMTLETSAGVAIESVTVPASSVPVSAPGGDTGGAVWVTANFTSPHVLSNGSSYNLRISTASDTTYTTFPVRDGGSDNSMHSYAFHDGTGQSTTNGSAWSDLYAYSHQDLQFYFTVVPAATHTRLAGADRYATAVAISQSAFQPQNPGAPFPVTVASGANFPDALAAGPVAAASDGPLLLVPGDGTLPTVVSTELNRLNPSRVNIAGGTAAVSDLVRSELQAFGADNVLTWAGQSRYDTAAQLAGITNGGLGKTVFIATGASFPDALGGSAAAGRLGGALMLTDRSALPAATASALTSGKPTKVVILGGDAVIDPAVLSQVKALLPSTLVERWFGADRYATAAAISSNTYPQGATTAYLASAADYPDALAGAPVAARAGAPLLLTSRDCVPVSTLAELHRLGADKIVVLGGTSAVSDAAADLTPCAG